MNGPDQSDDVHESELDFSALIAESIHDIKNSLAFILNTLDQALIAESGRLECSPERTVELNHEAQRANKALVQLLTLYRVENREYHPQRSEVDLADFVDDTFLRHEPLLKRKGLTLEQDVTPGLTACFDPYLVEGAIENLVINAMRFAKQRIRISAERVEGGFLSIQVADDGPGFPQEVQTQSASEVARSFRPSRFAAGDTKLGLYFCEMVAHAHREGARRGGIEVANGGVLGGSIVTIRLPCYH